uniref:Pentacotripeptide-repeat region of PRORP domain-containing protein n=1 Tax=Salix viminalis TaxID=40686 RepID=A0A6N2LSL3_SALVM
MATMPVKRQIFLLAKASSSSFNGFGSLGRQVKMMGNMFLIPFPSPTPLSPPVLFHHRLLLLSHLVAVEDKMTSVTMLSFLSSKQMELAGLSPDNYALNILINCFSNLLHVDLGFSVSAKIIKLGLQPDVVTFNTLINGLCKVGKTSQALDFFDDLVARGYRPDVHTYSTVMNGLSARLLGKMAEAGCQPDLVTYNTIVDRLCKDRLVNEALDIFSEMKAKGCHLHIFNTGLMQFQLSMEGSFGIAK